MSGRLRDVEDAVPYEGRRAAEVVGPYKAKPWGGCDLRQKKLAPRRSRANARRLCFRSFLLPFQIEPASLSFDLVFRENAIYMKTKMFVAGKVIGSQKKSACSYAGAKKCTFFFFHLKSKKASFIMPYVSIIHIY